MIESLSVPVTRAVDRTLRLLQLTYRMVALRGGTTAADALRHVAGYDDPDASAHALRKFEHDKKGLRRIGIPIVVQRVGEPSASCYKVRARDLLLPAPSSDRAAWDTLQAAAPSLQQLMEQLPALPVHTAASVATVGLAYAPDLSLQLPAWPIPRAMLTRAPQLLDWVHAVVYAAAVRGRAEHPWGGGPVRLATLTALTGLPEVLLRHIAVRGDARQASADVQQVVRITPAERERSMKVVAPELRAAWRPPYRAVQATIDTAKTLGMPLEEPVRETLRAFARGRGAATA